MENRILASNDALTDGRRTGLAGCTASDTCPRAPECMRAPLVHRYRAAPAKDEKGACRIFIRNG